MKAVTLWEPYATAIAAGIKAVETRSWRPPESLIGERIAIHAARQSFTAHGLVGGLVRQLSDHAKTTLAFACSDLTGRHGPIDDGASYPLGCVVATAVIFCVDPTTDVLPHIGADEQYLGDYGPGRWAWVLDGVRAVRPPVPVRGHQRIWNWEPPA